MPQSTPSFRMISLAPIARFATRPRGLTRRLHRRGRFEARCHHHAATRQAIPDGVRAATSPSPTLFSHTRPAAKGALSGARTGSSCGYACPAAGWPALMTHRTKTPWPTTKRPTTPSPPRCDVVQGCVGATSITARSDSCEWLRLVACLAWDQVAGLLATHRGSPVRLRLTGDKPELPHQPADQLRADLPAGADERDVLAPEPVGAVGVVEQLWLRGGRWQLEVEERANSGAVPLLTGGPSWEVPGSLDGHPTRHHPVEAPIRRRGESAVGPGRPARPPARAQGSEATPEGRQGPGGPTRR
jgi:hypothetical protein